jgi:hypothetical protein
MSLATQSELVESPSMRFDDVFSRAQPSKEHVDWNFKWRFQDSIFSVSQPQSPERDNLPSFSRFDNESPVLFSERRKSLERVYSFVDKSRVLRFIERNRLHGVLQESLNPLRQSFGPSLLRLEVLEDEEGNSVLICAITWPGEMQNARTALKEFDREWWLARARKFGSKLNFDFELV